MSRRRARPPPPPPPPRPAVAAVPARVWLVKLLCPDCGPRYCRRHDLSWLDRERAGGSGDH